MPICSCLKGFEPKNKEEWNGGNWTNGCVRKRLLLCERINQTGEAAREDGFLKLETMKLPYFAERTSIRAAECREKCLNNSCMAYAYEAGIHCMTWTGSLIDLQKFPINGEDLYIRLDQSELETGDNKVVIIVPVVVGIITFAICTFFLWRWMAKRKALKEKGKVLQSTEFSSEYLNEVTLQDLPLFDFEKSSQHYKGCWDIWLHVSRICNGRTVFESSRLCMEIVE
ncbi:hypothetical protein LWI29_015088 [Acer saccharum]|uniref:Apple domain-containing protein n=1 Tax=Acer saccharum TaxID=4024 RepID=A0AA39RRZ4_ACESA|nr:hypothetical protein LWI29_015088 [Acer saccharum]